MFKWSKLSEYRVKKVLECFCLDLTATQTAHLLKLNRKTVNALYTRFRLLIALKRTRPPHSPTPTHVLPVHDAPGEKAIS